MPNIDALWQVGAGVGFNLGDIASLSLAPRWVKVRSRLSTSDGDIVAAYPVYNEWWGVSGLARPTCLTQSMLKSVLATSIVKATASTTG